MFGVGVGTAAASTAACGALDAVCCVCSTACCLSRICRCCCRCCGGKSGGGEGGGGDGERAHPHGAGRKGSTWLMIIALALALFGQFYGYKLLNSDGSGHIYADEGDKAYYFAAWHCEESKYPTCAQYSATERVSMAAASVFFLLAVVGFVAPQSHVSRSAPAAFRFGIILVLLASHGGCWAGMVAVALASPRLADFMTPLLLLLLHRRTTHQTLCSHYSFTPSPPYYSLTQRLTIWQDYAWDIKFLVFFGALIGFIFCPPEVFDSHGYVWPARIGAFIFLILQQVILISFAYSLNETLLEWDEQETGHSYGGGSDSACTRWKALLLTLSVSEPALEGNEINELLGKQRADGLGGGRTD